MLLNQIYKLFSKLARAGVLHREELKNDLYVLRSLVDQAFVKKAYKKGKVFYELTEKALPLLERHRKVLLEQAKTLAELSPRSKVYRALLEDLRFLDEKNPRSQDFLFLGDWQLQRPVVPSQLKLAQYRYYQKQGLAA